MTKQDEEDSDEEGNTFGEDVEAEALALNDVAATFAEDLMRQKAQREYHEAVQQAEAEREEAN